MKTISSITIKKSVESAFNRSIDIKTRKRDVIYMRCIYYRLCRDLTYESLESIGKKVNKDHATVLHGLKTFDNIINEFWEKEYFLVYTTLKTRLQNRIKSNKKYQEPEGFYKDRYRIKLLQNKELYRFTNTILTKLGSMGHKFEKRLRDQLKTIVDDKNKKYNDKQNNTKN